MKAPFIILNFWRGDVTPLALFRDAVVELAKRGARFRAWNTSTRDGSDSTVHLEEVSSGFTWIDGQSSSASIRVEFTPVVLAHHGRFEVICVNDELMVEPVAQPVVRILMGGADFTLEGNHSRALCLGKQIRKSFVNLSESLNVAYGAITCEYEMESPKQLAADPRTYAFRDFYLAHELAKQVLPRSFQTDYADAFVEQGINGLYVSTTEFFDDYEISLDEKGYVLNSTVAKNIADALGR